MAKVLMQTKNPIFDDIAQIMGGAAGAMASAGEEMRSVLRSRTDQMIAEMDLVGREEFELVKEMAAKSLAENERLQEEIAALQSAAKKTSPRKTTKTRGAK